MANAISLTYDVKLDKAVQAFVQMAQKIGSNEEALKRLTQVTGKAGRELEKAAAAGATHFDKSGKAAKSAGEAVGGLVGKAAAASAGFMTLGGAIAFATAAFQKQRQAAEEAGKAIEGRAPLYRGMLGLPGGRAEAETVERRSQQIAESTGLAADEARAIALKAAQEGMGGDALTFAQAQASRGLMASPLIDTLDALREQFPQANLTGKGFIEQVLETQARVGSGDPNEIMESLKVVGPSLRRVGGSPEEMLALLSSLGERGASKQAKAALNKVADVVAEGVEIETPGATRATLDAAGRVTGYQTSPAVKSRRSFGGAGLVAGLAEFEHAAPEEFAARMRDDAAFNEGVTAIKAAGPALGETIKAIAAAAAGGRRLERSVGDAGGFGPLRAAADVQRARNALDRELEPEALEELGFERAKLRLRGKRQRELNEAPDSLLERGKILLRAQLEDTALDVQRTVMGPRDARLQAQDLAADRLTQAASALQSAAETMQRVYAPPAAPLNVRENDNGKLRR